jgi:hypothetical protein
MVCNAQACADLINNVVTDGPSFGSAGVPFGGSLTVTWRSDVAQVARVSILLTRDAPSSTTGTAFSTWDEPIYLAMGITNTNSWTWANAGVGMKPALKAGSGYRIIVWASKTVRGQTDQSFSIADACDTVQCGMNGKCSAGVCTCTGGWSGDRCAIGPCDAANCDPTHSTCSNSAFTLRAGSDIQAVCPCVGGYTGAQCRTPPACAQLTCVNGGDLVNVQLGANTCTGSCACRGDWTGANCQTCGLKCRNGGVANADCTACTSCPKGTYGDRCQWNFYKLTFQFVTDITPWFGVEGEAAAAARARFELTVSDDILVALRVATKFSVLVEVDEIKPINEAGVAKVLVTVRFSVEDGTSSSTVTGRRLLSTAELQSVYTAFAPQLSDSGAPLWQGQVTSKADPQWAVQGSDPSGMAVLSPTVPPRDCSVEDCSTTTPPLVPVNGDGSSDESLADKVLHTPLYLGLAIGAAAVALVLLIVLVVFTVRRCCRPSADSNTALKRLASTHTTSEHEGPSAFGGFETGGSGGFDARGRNDTEMMIVANPALKLSDEWNRI